MCTALGSKILIHILTVRCDIMIHAIHILWWHEIFFCKKRKKIESTKSFRFGQYFATLGPRSKNISRVFVHLLVTTVIKVSCYIKSCFGTFDEQWTRTSERVFLNIFKSKTAKMRKILRPFLALFVEVLAARLGENVTCYIHMLP